MCTKCARLREERDALEKSRAIAAHMLSRAIEKSSVTDFSLLASQASRLLADLQSAHRRFENHRLSHGKEES